MLAVLYLNITLYESLDEKNCALSRHSHNKMLSQDKVKLRICHAWVSILLYSHLHVHASQRHNIKDRRMKENTWRKTQEDFFNNILPLILLQGFERVVQGLHVRGCWRPNINFIFWPPLLWPSRCVFLVLLMLGSTPSGAFRGPPRSGVAFPTTSRL